MQKTKYQKNWLDVADYLVIPDNIKIRCLWLLTVSYRQFKVIETKKQIKYKNKISIITNLTSNSNGLSVKPVKKKHKRVPNISIHSL